MWNLAKNMAKKLAQTLTASYVDITYDDLNTQVAISHANQVSIDIVWHYASATRTLDVILWVSMDDMSTANASSTWIPYGRYSDIGAGKLDGSVQDVLEKASPGASGNLSFAPWEIPTTHRKMKVQARETGSGTQGTIDVWVNGNSTNA